MGLFCKEGDHVRRILNQIFKRLFAPVFIEAFAINLEMAGVRPNVGFAHFEEGVFEISPGKDERRAAGGDGRQRNQGTDFMPEDIQQSKAERHHGAAAMSPSHNMTSLEARSITCLSCVEKTKVVCFDWFSSCMRSRIPWPVLWSR